MSVENTQTRRPRRAVVIQVSVVLAMGLALGACSKEEPAAPAATAPAPAAAPAVTAETAVSAKVSALSVEQLREAARTAYAENRLYAPVENNAVEYYLALRDKAPADAAVSSALTDLLPMTVIATEQSINREDFTEAQRLAALLERADAQHPALARLRASIAAQQATAAQRAQQEVLTAEEEAKKKTDLEKQRLADQKAQQDSAAKQLAQQQASEKAAADRAAAEKRAADQRAAEQRAAAATATPAPTQTATAAAAPSASDLRPVSMPGPKYPPEALRAGQAGEVLVEYTVGVDGSVTAARVVRSTPARIFDREAINAVRRWRFQPVAAPITSRRTIGFKPGE